MHKDEEDERTQWPITNLFISELNESIGSSVYKQHSDYVGWGEDCGVSL